MSDDMQKENLEVVDTTKEEEVKVPAGQTIEQQILHLQTVNKEVVTSRDATKRKLRELEKQFEEVNAKSAKLEGLLRNKVTDGILREALKEAGAIAVPTALRLVDLSKVKIDDEYNVDIDSVKSIIETLKTSDPVLFQTPMQKETNIDVKRPQDGNQIGSYEREMKAAKSQREIEAILKKYRTA